ncbi:hypothetical protein BDZ91DRAFT_851972 [Kalaharituber pfeilii]|nr:hypothetical protein BDZ91DRAFT_851972 [Kalaharituber pfeilii]
MVEGRDTEGRILESGRASSQLLERTKAHCEARESSVRNEQLGARDDKALQNRERLEVRGDEDHGECETCGSGQESNSPLDTDIVLGGENSNAAYDGDILEFVPEILYAAAENGDRHEDQTKDLRKRPGRLSSSPNPRDPKENVGERARRRSLVPSDGLLMNKKRRMVDKDSGDARVRHSGVGSHEGDRARTLSPLNKKGDMVGELERPDGLGMTAEALDVMANIDPTSQSIESSSYEELLADSLQVDSSDDPTTRTPSETGIKSAPGLSSPSNPTLTIVFLFHSTFISVPFPSLASPPSSPTTSTALGPLTPSTFTQESLTSVLLPHIESQPALLTHLESRRLWPLRLEAVGSENVEKWVGRMERERDRRGARDVSPQWVHGDDAAEMGRWIGWVWGVCLERESGGRQDAEGDWERQQSELGEEMLWAGVRLG